MNNLILGLAFGYELEKMKPFILSLRQYYDDDVLLIVSSMSKELEDFYNEYNITTFSPDTALNKNTCQVERYEMYLECITEHFLNKENFLLADVRDIVFQQNPFLNFPNNELEFFAEPEKFKNCKHNRPWIMSLYGEDRVKAIDNEYVICSGTTMGKRNGILTYLKAMVEEISRLKENGRPPRGGEDQPIHNHLVYNTKFNNYAINHNDIGPISTMHHSTNLNFNRQGYLLNKKGKIIPIVHQYDRLGAFSLVFLKNALQVKGANGIKTVAKYATDNFYDHDL